jgi:hypothetical protein
MIEAQALYINALIKKVKSAREKGGSLRLQPKHEVVQKYNEEIQARLEKSAFADPNCNSWYKNEAGLITNNWAYAVIPYQKRTSSIDWDDYDAIGTGANDLKAEGHTRWARVVEETQVSNAVILAALTTGAAAALAGTLYRGAFKSALR